MQLDAIFLNNTMMGLFGDTSTQSQDTRYLSSLLPRLPGDVQAAFLEAREH